MPAHRTARTTRAQQLQLPSSPQQRSSLRPPPSSSPLRCASSPFLPELILQTRRQDPNTRLRHAEEEQERMVMNEMVCDLCARAEAAPDNSVKQQEYVFKRDDYEERFGKFVPDSEHGAWFARRDSEHTKGLCALRELIVDLSPFEDGATLQEYFDKEDVFAREFGITFEADDGNDATLQNKRQLLYYYRKLLERAKGDMHVAARLAGRNYLLTVVTPFHVKDDRRMEFDLKLRRWAAKLQGVNIATLKPTFSNIEFRFKLLNKFETGDERWLHNWCQRHVWGDFIKEEVAAARERARLLPPVRRPVSPATFYGRS